MWGGGGVKNIYFFSLSFQIFGRGHGVYLTLNVRLFQFKNETNLRVKISEVEETEKVPSSTHLSIGSVLMLGFHGTKHMRVVNPVY